MKDLRPMNELSTELQEKTGDFIDEVYKFTTPFGKFYASLTNGNYYDNSIQVCFTGSGVTQCYELAVEALEAEENIAKLTRYCLISVLNSALVSSLEYNIGE